MRTKIADSIKDTERIKKLDLFLNDDYGIESLTFRIDGCGDVATIRDQDERLLSSVDIGEEVEETGEYPGGGGLVRRLLDNLSLEKREL